MSSQWGGAMILKLNKLLLTSTHLGGVLVSYLDRIRDSEPGGVFATGHFLVSAGALPCAEVWISNQQDGRRGEGMGTTAAKLEAFLLDRLHLEPTDGAGVAELRRDELDSLIADFFVREF